MDDDLDTAMERCPYCTRFRWEHDDLKWRRHQMLYRGSWGSATPTDWEDEGRKAAAEGLTSDQAAERFGKLMAGSATPTAPKRCDCSDAEIDATLAGSATPTEPEHCGDWLRATPTPDGDGE